MSTYQFCPRCKEPLLINEKKQEYCPVCKYKHYNNPVPAVAAMITWKGGVVVVKRNRPPFVGQYCLPCGFVDPFEDPEDAVKREALEETGLLVKPVDLLWAVTPYVPEDPVNQVVLHYRCVVTGGSLKPGDDAAEAFVAAPREMPILCFSTHQRLVTNWFEKYIGIRQFV